MSEEIVIEVTPRALREMWHTIGDYLDVPPTSEGLPTLHDAHRFMGDLYLKLDYSPNLRVVIQAPAPEPSAEALVAEAISAIALYKATGANSLDEALTALRAAKKLL